MEYVKSILQRAWNINADDMEYMKVGSPELEEAFKKQKEIEDAIEKLNSKGLPEHINQALNEGDGTYRP